MTSDDNYNQGNQPQNHNKSGSFWGGFFLGILFTFLAGFAICVGILNL